jgi:hypothetical protein
MTPNYFDAKAMLAKAAEKMYTVLTKDLVDRVLRDHTVDKLQVPSLPLLSSLDTEGSPPNNRGVDTSE